MTVLKKWMPGIIAAILALGILTLIAWVQESMRRFSMMLQYEPLLIYSVFLSVLLIVFGALIEWERLYSFITAARKNKLMTALFIPGIGLGALTLVPADYFVAFIGIPGLYSPAGILSSLLSYSVPRTVLSLLAGVLLARSLSVKA
jgi:hypothetical protein